MSTIVPLLSMNRWR